MGSSASVWVLNVAMFLGGPPGGPTVGEPRLDDGKRVASK